MLKLNLGVSKFENTQHICLQNKVPGCVTMFLKNKRIHQEQLSIDEMAPFIVCVK